MLANDATSCSSQTRLRAAVPRILLVDDEPSILRSLARALRALRPSWSVHVAGSGGEALCHLRTAPYDAVVTDLEMPGIDGLSLLSRVLDEHPEVVRLVHSSRIDDEVPETLGRLAQGAVAKPAHPDRVIDLIENALATQRSVQAA